MQKNEKNLIFTTYNNLIHLMISQNWCCDGTIYSCKMISHKFLLYSLL